MKWALLAAGLLLSAFVGLGIAGYVVVMSGWYPEVLAW